VNAQTELETVKGHTKDERLLLDVTGLWIRLTTEVNGSLPLTHFPFVKLLRPALFKRLPHGYISGTATAIYSNDVY